MRYEFLNDIPGSIRKPPPRDKVKRKAEREEKKVKTSVRSEVEDRDGHCVLRRKDAVVELPPDLVACQGRSEWAHALHKRRSKTMGMPPEDRHQVKASMQLCTKHHRLYDASEMAITPHTQRGMNGAFTAALRESKVKT